MEIKDMINELLSSMSYEEIAYKVKCSRKTIERAKNGYEIRKIYEDNIKALYGEKESH